MDLPKFLIADSSELEDTIFVIHTAYPRFLINVINDEIHWMEEFEKEDLEELERLLESSSFEFDISDDVPLCFKPLGES